MNLSTRRLTALLAGLVLAFAFGCERPTAPNQTEDSTSGETPMNADQLPYAPQGAAAAAAKARAATEAPAPTAGLTGAALGHKLYTSLACVTCHTTDGSRGLAPTFKGVYGSTVALSDGSKVTVDDAYIKESILNPQAKLVQGFAPVMPSFTGRVSPEDLDALCAYLKTVR
jgi:mono/diheme cytochrome c family protein